MYTNNYNKYVKLKISALLMLEKKEKKRHENNTSCQDAMLLRSYRSN